MITVHLVMNAHLDPIWLWPWQAGLDEALATCRSACDRLDKHPDVIFTRGEAWVYEQIERIDPKLFARIVEHVKAGRWEIVGGWYIQPDCNLPSGFAMDRQIEIGKRYFLERFGFFPKIAYNVDSFGHAATFPRMLRRHGQDRYVMMRPQSHEMALPARLFRWRGYEGGEEVVTFRIARAYCTSRGVSEEHVRASITHLPEGVEHTMCFIGVGDHGGGPTEKIIRWCREHENAFDGMKLVFSSPRRFFDAIEPHVASLPVVTGELQHHAIGCYSVKRGVKTAVRKAEHALKGAEIAIAADPAPEKNWSARLDEEWRHVCFHQFHDTLGGTCIHSAYEQIEAQLGGSIAFADEVMQVSLRRQLNALPDDKMQRLVLFNASDRRFDGYTTVEPWLEWAKWQPHWRLLDEQGRAVAHQPINHEASSGGLTRLLIRIAIDPGQMRVIRIDRGVREAASGGVHVIADQSAIASMARFGVKFDQRILMLNGQSLPMPELHLIEDMTDTWSHGIDRYAEAPVDVAQWDEPENIDKGPLMASILRNGTIGKSELLAEWRVYADQPMIELQLRVNWRERRRMLKLHWTLPHLVSRVDGIMGGSVRRELDGRERPLRDWIQVSRNNGENLAVVAPDVYAADATPERLRLTLLRSAILAHHDPDPGAMSRQWYSDQGEHVFRFAFLTASADEAQRLDDLALMWQRPPVVANLTRGMPTRPMRCQLELDDE